jgi:hypothetical protein
VRASVIALVFALVLALAGCNELGALHNMSVPRHYLSAGGGAGVATGGDFAGDAVVQYHYTPRLLYRTGLSARSTTQFLNLGPDLELDPNKYPVRLTVNGGYSVGYASPDTWYLGGGLRWQFLSSRFRLPNNADSQYGLSVAPSYEARFGNQPDVFWLSLLFHYVPARPE